MDITRIYLTNECLNYCRRLAGSQAEDLYQETIVILLTKDTIKHDNIIGYFKLTAKYLYFDKYSCFNKKYNPKQIDYDRYELSLEENTTTGVYMDAINEILKTPAKDKRENFVNEVFREYINEGCSSRRLADKVGINYSVICKAVNKFKNKVNEHINKRID